MKWAGRNSFPVGPRRKALSPTLFWQVMRSLGKLFSDPEERSRAMYHLVPRCNPGSAMLRGNNITKALTYRATYVPGGFNVERNQRRHERAMEEHVPTARDFL